MAIIKLTQGYETVIDDEDLPVVSRYKWHAQIRHDRNGKVTANARINGKNVKLHGFLTGAPMTDHWDGDTLNNRRSNLRACNNSQNQANRKLNSDSTTGFKGVHRNNSSRTFYAEIKHDKKRKRLGSFPYAIFAALAYNAAARELHGSFARPNPIVLLFARD